MSELRYLHYRPIDGLRAAAQTIESDFQRTFLSTSSDNWPLMSYTTLCEVRWALSDQVLQQSAMENVMDMKLPLSAERHWQATVTPLERLD